MIMIGASAGLTLRYVGSFGRFVGNSARAAEIPAWTSRAAPSMLRDRSNISVTTVVPSELCEVISLTPAIRPSCRSSGVATVAAIACTGLYAFDHSWHLLEVEGRAEELIYYFLPISLPVVAAAFMSFISINDLHRRLARYREMIALLTSARKQIVYSQTWSSLERIVQRTERALLQEVLEWHSITSFSESH